MMGRGMMGRGMMMGGSMMGRGMMMGGSMMGRGMMMGGMKTGGDGHSARSRCRPPLRPQSRRQMPRMDSRGR